MGIPPPFSSADGPTLGIIAYAVLKLAAIRLGDWLLYLLATLFVVRVVWLAAGQEANGEVMPSRFKSPSAAWLVAFALMVAGATGAVAAPRGPEILTDDVTRFFTLYDAAGGKPTVEQLDDYLARGSTGFRHFAVLRNVTGARIADTIGKRPEIYANARRCLDVLPAVRRRLADSFVRLEALYPEAKFPPVTLVIGRGKPVGLTDGEGVTMGVEALCAADFMHPDIKDRFVHTIAHEYGHIQQPAALQALEPGHPEATVLRMSLMEGAAEFAGELISGDVGNYQHRTGTRGREAEIGRAFLAEQDSLDLSNWLYNGVGTAERPGDLGYWVGYRVVKAYYARATDKRQALRDIFRMDDPKAFLAASGWRPGD